jgi:hypothetical protein
VKPSRRGFLAFLGVGAATVPCGCEGGSRGAEVAPVAPSMNMPVKAFRDGSASGYAVSSSAFCGPFGPPFNPPLNRRSLNAPKRDPSRWRDNGARLPYPDAESFLDGVTQKGTGLAHPIRGGCRNEISVGMNDDVRLEYCDAVSDGKACAIMCCCGHGKDLHAQSFGHCIGLALRDGAMVRCDCFNFCDCWSMV